MGRQIAIVGAATRSRLFHTSLPEEAEVWGMNENHMFQTRADRWFQIHPRNWRSAEMEAKGVLPDFYGRPEVHVDVLSRMKIPIYMQQVDDRIYHSVAYPYDKIVESLGLDLAGKKTPYLTSTAAWALALMCYEHMQYRWWQPWTRKWKVDRFWLPGIEMQIGTEYSAQKPCVEYYIGMAQGLGIEFVPIAGQELLRAPVYAIDHDVPFIDDVFVPVNKQAMRPRSVEDSS